MSKEETNVNSGEMTAEEKAVKELLQKNLADIEEFEDAEKFSPESLRVIYQKVCEDFENKLKEADSSVEELEAMEAHINKLQDTWDKEVIGRSYELAEDIEWHGKTYTRKQVGQKINAILDKYECEYSYTLGMWQLAMWWKNPGKTIDYSTINSTSRVLGTSGIKFKGPQEWENILIVNEFLRSCDDEFMRDILHTTLLALRHNAIVDQLTLKKPQAADGRVAEVEAPQEGNIEMVEA